MSRRSRTEGGFTLIEVLLVVFFLGVICITLISVFVYGLNLLAKTTQTNAATQVAQFEIERYRNMGFADVPIQDVGVPVTFQTLYNDAGGDVPSNAYAFLFKDDNGVKVPILRNGRETIVVRNGDAIEMDLHVKKMTITIEWDYRNRTIAGGDPMRRDFVTIFSANGINRR